MRRTYDIIIIGAGISGLGAGALLARSGKKVLILEKNREMGGFARSFRPFPGYYFDQGIHGLHLSTKSALAELFRRVGKPLPETGTYPSPLKTETFHGGRWKRPEEIVDFNEMVNTYRRITQTAYEEIDQLEDISFKDFIMPITSDPGTHHFMEIMASILCSIRRWEDASAAEVVHAIKNSMEAFPGEPFNVPPVKGGYDRLVAPLAEAAREGRVEIRTEAAVSEIVITDGKVRGVEIDKGIRSEKGFICWDMERMESPVVICTIPLWDLFRVVREEVFPSWYVAWVKRVCENLNQCWTIYAGLKEPLWEPPDIARTMTRMECIKDTHGGTVGYHWNLFDPESAPEGEYNFFWLAHSNSLEFPELLEPEKARNRRRIVEVFDRMEAELKEMFPKFRKALWVVRHAQNMYIAKQPGYVGRHMPGIRPPEIEGLYLIGDKVRARGAGVGGNLAAITAMECAEMILEK